MDGGWLQYLLYIPRWRSSMDFRASFALPVLADGDHLHLNVSLSTRTQKRGGNRVGSVLVLSQTGLPPRTSRPGGGSGTRRGANCSRSKVQDFCQNFTSSGRGTRLLRVARERSRGLGSVLDAKHRVGSQSPHGQ